MDPAGSRQLCRQYTNTNTHGQCAGQCAVVILSGQDPENNSDLSCITRSKKIKVIYTGKFPIKSFLPNPTPLCLRMLYAVVTDRKSTSLNSSHSQISYA